MDKEARFAAHRTRFIQIGAAAGSTISLSADLLRTLGVEMTGAGNISPQVVPEASQQVWKWIQAHPLQVDFEEVPVKEIAEAW